MNIFNGNQEQQIIQYFPQIIMAVMILASGLIIAYICRYASHRWIKLNKNKVLQSFLSNLIFILILIITIIMVLSKLGVPTGSLVAIMGAASLAIGLALRDFLANIAAGFMIVFLKPFKVNDYIIVNGTAGTIIDINLFMTRLKSSTNECVFIPNNKVITNSIVNQSYYNSRRQDLIIGVDYSADLKQTKEIFTDILTTNSLVLQDPAPIIGVDALGDSSVSFLLRFWTERVNLITAKLVLVEEIKARLTEANINIPFPQMDVHIKKSDS